MRPATGLNVPMSIEELEQLRTIANNNLRHPREQARYLLRQALGLTCEDVQPQHVNHAEAVVKAVPSVIAG